jgi:hypothetical protein
LPRAQKNSTASKEARARRRGQADMSALYGTEKKRITHEIQSRVGKVRRENKEKLRKGDRVFNYINRKSGEVGLIPAIRVSVFVQLSSNGRTGRLSKVNFLEIRAGAGLSLLSLYLAANWAISLAGTHAELVSLSLPDSHWTCA